MSNNFYQDKTWATSDGQVVRLKDMSPSHRFNLLRWMNRHAETLEFNNAMMFLAFDGDTPDEVVDELARRDPHEWLASTPLHRKLRKLVKRDTKDKADPGRVQRRLEKAKRRRAKALHPANGVPVRPVDRWGMDWDWREDGDWGHLPGPASGFAQRVYDATSGSPGFGFASPGDGFHPSAFGIPGEMGMPESDY